MNPRPAPAGRDASESEVWQGVRDLVARAEPVSLGRFGSEKLRTDPVVWPELLARCKFAQKALGQGRRLLHLGCGDGLGTAVLTEFTADYLGVDTSPDVVADAQATWGNDDRQFEHGVLDAARPGFTGVVDFALPLAPAALAARLEAIAGSLETDGVAVVGAEINGPASVARLREALASRFLHVLPFAMHEDRVLAGCRGDEGYAMMVAAGPQTHAVAGVCVEPENTKGSAKPPASDKLSFGPFWSYVARQTPRRLLYTLAYYRFAARLIGGASYGQPSRRVLDVGCGEGGGTHLIGQACGFAHGVDFDEDSVAAAQQNWPSGHVRFDCTDLHDIEAGRFDAVVNFDVVEHLRPESADGFFTAMASRLTLQGVAVVGTPNVTSQVYANAVTNAGHINLYDGPGLAAAMGRAFEHVMLFGANDETVHTGFPPMCHYLIAVGMGPRAAAATASS
ncbi:MAG: class I SAM-dependent methyltransferase [Planctomycetota bacterium]